MASGTGRYIARMNDASISTAVSFLYISNPSTGMLKILRVSCTQRSTTTSAADIVTVLRKSGTVTLPTSITPVPAQTSQPASGVTATSGIATAEGSDGVILHKEGFNILNGMLWIPTPDEQFWVPPSGAIALKFEIAPTSANYTAEIAYEEFG